MSVPVFGTWIESSIGYRLQHLLQRFFPLGLGYSLLVLIHAASTASWPLMKLSRTTTWSDVRTGLHRILLNRLIPLACTQKTDWSKPLTKSCWLPSVLDNSKISFSSSLPLLNYTLNALFAKGEGGGVRAAASAKGISPSFRPSVTFLLVDVSDTLIAIGVILIVPLVVDFYVPSFSTEKISSAVNFLSCLKHG